MTEATARLLAAWMGYNYDRLAESGATGGLGGPFKGGKQDLLDLAENIESAEIQRLKTDICERAGENTNLRNDLVLVGLARESEMAEASAEIRRLTTALADAKDNVNRRDDFMRGRGYRRCDIAACNCNSWHGGHADNRLREIGEAIVEAGGSTNGIVFTTAIINLGATLTAAQETIARIREALELFMRKAPEINYIDGKHDYSEPDWCPHCSRTHHLENHSPACPWVSARAALASSAERPKEV